MDNPEFYFREAGGVRTWASHSPFLQRHLPFWLSVLVQQVVALFIPVAGLLYPLLRISPRIFLWVASRRVYRLYSELRLLEEELASASSDKAGKDFIERLDRLEPLVGAIVPQTAALQFALAHQYGARESSEMSNAGALALTNIARRFRLP